MPDATPQVVHPAAQQPILRRVIGMALLGAVYGLIARVSIHVLPTVGDTNVALIWPPTGIAIAAVWTYGYRLWPGIAVAMTIANAGQFLGADGESVRAASVAGLVLSALGDAMEPVVAVFLIRRLDRRACNFDRGQDAFKFLAVVAVAAAICATTGVSGLWLKGLEATNLGTKWLVWWISNIVGAIVVAPPLIILAARRRRLTVPGRWYEGVIIGGLLTAIALTCLVPDERWWIADYRLEYLTLPFVLWGVFRFRMYGAVAATVIVAVAGVWGAMLGRGAFASAGPQASLVLVQLYVGVVGLTALVLAGVLTERAVVYTQLRRQRDHLDEQVQLRSEELTATVERLRASENQYQLITDNVPAAIAYITRDLRYDFVNDVYCQWAGLPAERIRGQRADDVLPAELFRAVRDRFEHVLAGDRVSFELTLVSPIGQQRWVSFVCVPDCDGNDEIRGFFALGYDVTERKEAEQRLQAYSSRLEESNRELESFASVASHDLQEPLRKIQAFGERLAAETGDGLSEKSQDYLDRMRGAALRMQTLIDDLLQFSRVTTKARPFERVELDTLVRGVLEDLEFSIEQSGAQLEIGPLGWIDADPIQMRQLLQNLIGNALKFRHPDRDPLIRLWRETAGGEDDVQGAAARCRLIIIDNGIGFDPAYAERIFHVFQRLHGRGAYEGTGIGLAICRKIAERHGGTITADANPGGGATFTVELPVFHSQDQSGWL